MAKYITVICRVKGETVLKLINDFNCVDDNVYYHKDIDETSGQQFDLSRVKLEVTDSDDVVQQLAQSNDNSDCPESEEYDYDYDSSDNPTDGCDSDTGFQTMDGYKQYLSIIKTNGRQMFCCKYKVCKYQTLWKNAIINHIRTNHINYYPFICGFPDCGKRFAIRSNLNNHRKVHSKTKSSAGNYLEDNDFEHSFSHNSFNETESGKTCAQKKMPIVQNIGNQTIDIKPRIIAKKGKSKTKRVSKDKSSSAQKPVFVGVKSVEPYIKKTERNGKIWRSCLFPDCSYGSRYATSIVYHIRNHHLNDKPYICAICGKPFAMRTNLNNHKKVHKSVNRKAN